MEESKDTQDNVYGDNRIKLGPVFGNMVDISISVDGDIPMWADSGLVARRRPFDSVTVNLLVDSKDCEELMAWARDMAGAGISLRRE